MLVSLQPILASARKQRSRDTLGRAPTPPAAVLLLRAILAGLPSRTLAPQASSAQTWRSCGPRPRPRSATASRPADVMTGAALLRAGARAAAARAMGRAKAATFPTAASGTSRRTTSRSPLSARSSQASAAAPLWWSTPVARAQATELRTTSASWALLGEPFRHCGQRLCTHGRHSHSRRRRSHCRPPRPGGGTEVSLRPHNSRGTSPSLFRRQSDRHRRGATRWSRASGRCWQSSPSICRTASCACGATTSTTEARKGTGKGSRP
mmetsp:Transcript_18088/g.49931  ORF Transcript_18088/g.49931 Transcript_18088/m.49931 type:complete len:266 (-) Transcript_18088:184-981(-)